MQVITTFDSKNAKLHFIKIRCHNYISYVSKKLLVSESISLCNKKEFAKSEFAINSFTVFVLKMNK